MQTSDRSRVFRSLGLAVAALLLVGGAVFGSQALTGASRTNDATQPSASADEQGNHENGDGSASESPEASAVETADESPGETANETAGENVNEDVNDENASESPEASGSETKVKQSDASESPEASESPDQHGGDGATAK